MGEGSFAPETPHGVAGPEIAAATRAEPRPPLFDAGETIDLGSAGARYQIVRPLGRGGMAEVFLARRLGPAGFAREVALKFITADLEAHDRFRRAFLYEARLASRLRHPNIAEAYDLAEAGGRYHLVLEYVDGVTAKSAIDAARRRGRQLSEGFCCHVAASVAEGLHYAHGLTDDDGRPLGIVHRDVTGPNVMIARSGAVKLLDFGIALARIQGRDRTETGLVKGTHAYFSPERASGGPMDGRSDLFSLGVLFVELLTGKRVFDDASDLATIRRISDCKRADVVAATSKLPRGLREICETALAKRPADRFQEGAELAEALRAYAHEKGPPYSPSHCVEEVLSLGGFGTVPGEGGIEGGLAPELAGADEAAGPDARPCPPEHRADPGRHERAARRWRMVAAAVAVAGVLVLMLLMLKRSRSWELPAASRAVETARWEGGRSEPSPGASPGQSEATSVGPMSALGDGPVVRPKRVGAAGSGTGGPTATVKGHDQRTRGPRSSTSEFADRQSVASVSLTLPRGTLIPAKLLRSIDPMAPGAVPAEVTEEVAKEGVLLVPRGSSIACSSRASRDGRVPLSCDSIKTGNRLLLFSGLAVGEGQHVGLRVLDNAVPTGTPFVVYVNAPAAIR